MSLHLVPYNETMRLGMGFNSFTHQVCTDDVVKLSGGKGAATEQALRRLVDDPHEITWSAKFVDRVNEVIDGLNVSAALYIRCDATDSGETTPASFFDLHKFTESDINYWIQFKVTTQRFVCPSLTEFSPIENVPQSDFTRVYGDSFISGFTEGGEFNALISIKLRDTSKVEEVRGQLKAGMESKAAAGQGGDFGNGIDGETTIAVFRKGGGSIKEEKVEWWSLETLYAVAKEFPTRVPGFPVRMNAIVTKFTSLKSFRTANLMGTLPDYKMAGVYLSTLLDAYIDYKVMLRNISAVVSEVEKKQSELVAKDNLVEFTEMNRKAKEYYQRELDFNKQKVSGKHIASNTTTAVDDDASSEGSWDSVNQKGIKSSTGAASAVSVSDAGFRHPAQNDRTILTVMTSFLPRVPIPPNDLVPYKANIFGLEKARRDCRLEIVKILREIDTVAEDPEVASDPNRTWQCLSPSVFRMLLPTVKNLDKEKTAKEAILAVEASAKLQEELRYDLNEVKRTLKETEEKLRVNEQAVNELNPYGGWCPVPLDTPIRFRSYTTRQCMDYEFTCGREHRMWDAGTHPHQKWIITRAKTTGFYIRQLDSGRYLATDNAGADGRVYLTTQSHSGNVFTFEKQDGNTVLIHLADRNHLTMQPEGGKHGNGTHIVMSPHAKGDNDRWYVKNFGDLS
ncbi:hypothetical protein VKT23_011582 [Stygiomarasmius scandens]|uniref:Ricin B lectin domain-containing protein n=1 Tax=Marasmiellus scandens TaxID=2682957 RepID=A0ABR1J8L2_9AGAR